MRYSVTSLTARRELSAPRRCQLPLLSPAGRNHTIESTFRIACQATLTQLSLLASARSRVLCTDLTISVKRLLTTASKCGESHPPIEVNVANSILKQSRPERTGFQTQEFSMIN